MAFGLMTVVVTVFFAVAMAYLNALSRVVSGVGAIQMPVQAVSDIVAD